VNWQSDDQIKARLREFRGALRDCRECVEDAGTSQSIHRKPTFPSLPNNLESAPYANLIIALEPSAEWPKDEGDAWARIGQGFVSSQHDKPNYLLPLSTSGFLLRGDEGQCPTDVVA